MASPYLTYCFIEESSLIIVMSASRTLVQIFTRTKTVINMLSIRFSMDRSNRVVTEILRKQGVPLIG